MLSMSVTIAVLIAVGIGALFGLWRGFSKAVFRLASVVLAALLTYFLAVPITGAFVTPKNINSVVVWLEMEEAYGELIAISPLAEELIRALAISILSTIVFILLFFVMKLLMFIPYKIISNRVKIIEEENFKIRLIGLPVGALQGLLSIMVIVFILAGFFNLADNAMNTIMMAESGSIRELQEDLAPVDSIMNEVKKDPVMSLLCYSDEEVEELSERDSTSMSVSLVSHGKNNFVFEGLTKIRFNGKKMSLTKEFSAITTTALRAMPLLDDSSDSITDAQIIALGNVVDTFGESELLTEVGAELISSACEKWSEGEKFLGVEFDSVNEDLDSIIYALFGSMKDSTAETLKEDLHSLVDILTIFSRYDLLSSLEEDSIMQNLSGDFIEELLTTLSSNERFSVVIPEVTNLSIKMIAEALNIEDVSDLLLPSGHCELSEEDIKNLSEGFDHILRFIDSLESIEGDVSFDTLNAIDITAMGQALDAFKNTSLLGNAIDPIAGAVVSGVTGSTSSGITDALVSGDVSYESLMDTVQSTANVMNNMKDENATVEEKQEAIVQLFENITPENAEVIIAAVDESFVVQMGVDEKYAEQYADVLSVSLKEMANLDGAEHEAEAEKVKYIFDIVSNSDKNAYGEDGVFESVDDLISVAMDSKVAGAVIMELAYDDNGNEAYDALGIAGSISDEDRNYIFTEINNYQNEMTESASPEEAERIDQMCEAIYVLILGMK